MTAETEKIYAWVAKDLDGVEGIIVYPSEDFPVALVSVNRDLARQLWPMAAEAALARGHTAYLVCFTRSEIVDEVTIP